MKVWLERSDYLQILPSLILTKIIVSWGWWWHEGGWLVAWMLSLFMQVPRLIYIYLSLFIYSLTISNNIKSCQSTITINNFVHYFY